MRIGIKRKHSRKVCWLLLIALILLIPVQSFPAAWTLKKGKSQIINTISYYTTASFYDADGKRSSSPRFNKLEYNPYAETGLTDSLTLGISPSVQYLTQSSDSNFGVSYADIFLRKRLWHDDWSVVSVQPLIKIPGYYDENLRPSLGARQFDFELRGLYGHSFSYVEQFHYVNFGLAYRSRMGLPGDEIKFDVELGLRPREDWTIMSQVFTTFSTDSKNSVTSSIANPTNYDAIKLQLSAVKKLNDKFSLQAGVFQNVLSHNTGGGGGALLSLWVEF